MVTPSLRGSGVSYSCTYLVALRRRGDGKQSGTVPKLAAPPQLQVRARQDGDSHKVALEELLQPLLGCRVGQVSDVEAATLSGAGGVGIGWLLGDGSVGQSGSHVVDGGVSGLVLLGGRHFGWLICVVVGWVILWGLGGVSQDVELCWIKLS
jgi:hypothetical protein